MSRALGITTAFTVLATIAVALRLFTRFRMVRTAGWDDGMSFMSLVCAISLVIKYQVQILMLR
jgi:hypothetical protein